MGKKQISALKISFVFFVSVVAIMVFGARTVAMQAVEANVNCPANGDVNEDENITPQDALMAFQHYLGIITLNTCQIDRADVNSDNSVTPADALCIFKKYLGLDSCLGVNTVTVPNVGGGSRSEAEAAITAADLTVGTVTEELRITMPTGEVISQNPVPGTETPLGSTIDLVVVKAPPVGEIIPDIWAGKWKITMTFPKEIQEINSEICPGDSIGVALIESILADSNPVCTKTASENRFEASCSSLVVYNTCTFDISMQIGVDLNGAIMTGTGEWAVTIDCPLLPTENESETFEISGVRQITDPGMCQSSSSSFLQKFMRHSYLRLIEETYNE